MPPCWRRKCDAENATPKIRLRKCDAENATPKMRRFFGRYTLCDMPGALIVSSLRLYMSHVKKNPVVSRIASYTSKIDVMFVTCRDGLFELGLWRSGGVLGGSRK